MKKFLLAAAITATAVLASATNFKVRLYQTSTINGTELKPGEYRAEVSGDKVTLRSGKMAAEAPVKVETTGGKFDGTSVRYSSADGKFRITEIRIGGTGTKLIIEN